MTGDHRAAVRGALLQLRRETGLPIALGGTLAAQGRLKLTEQVGTVTNVLRGFSVEPGVGLGGKVLALGRVIALNDYATALTITHDYDAVVNAEGIRSVVAAPVVVRRKVRAVLYTASRTSTVLGDRVMSSVVDAARTLEQDLVVQDEVDERVRRLHEADRSRRWGAEWESVRQAHAELRLIAQRTPDHDLRAELHGVCDQLTSPPPASSVRLTSRELDVLTWVATGCANAEIARRLCLSPETVKSYLREAMRKLDVHGRGEAVVAARRAGLLP
ncbi:LuxR C-terminal-related transcriptional regulator [Allokutzneria sp. A3M-2-11 16]|uniref:LuxR C-terminal-related transcriptional regulator n=1 Tax=Allokutzneria sp. A3M-2-11 16 TaxID=2962043 RepID=UPI0020B75BBF|nr:LuxR C-terminal-related transcriptional regulator [Allokutzneria sp. A3M-2-11 16]MCP3804019.1 LuxR C-terminal-related transcriptional regulator [Allokutzneria sp. A3M-2-11 16]